MSPSPAGRSTRSHFLFRSLKVWIISSTSPSVTSASGFTRRISESSATFTSGMTSKAAKNVNSAPGAISGASKVGGPASSNDSRRAASTKLSCINSAATSRRMDAPNLRLASFTGILPGRKPFTRASRATTRVCSATRSSNVATGNDTLIRRRRPSELSRDTCISPGSIGLQNLEFASRGSGIVLHET